MSTGTMTPRTPRTPGTPYPVGNSAVVNDLLTLMKTNLNTLGATFDSLGEQSAKVATLGPAMDTAHQIHQLRRQMRNQEKTQDSRINDIRSFVRDDLKVQIAEHMRQQIEEQIKAEIALQVKDEVSNQITTHLPIPLAIQAAESQEQLAEVRTSLQNTEARRHNSALGRGNLDDPLAVLVRADGTPSEHFPVNLRQLFSYEPEVVRDLVEDYGLKLHKVREGNVNRFLSFVGPVRWAEKELAQLIAPHAEVLHLTANSREEFAREVREAPLAEIVGIFRRNESVSQIGRFDAELIGMLPSSVKWIAHCGAGYDQVDVAACKARGIIVSNTPGAVDEATATTALFLIISACRRFSQGEILMRSGRWNNDFPLSHDPNSKVLGILGFGGIGRRTAEMARVLPMRVAYHSRNPANDAPEWAEYCATLEELLEKTDVLSVHVPLNAQTKGMIGEKEIRRLKKGSVIVNTARGEIIDEDALIGALQDGHIYAAGLDVFTNEPRGVNPIWRTLPNVTVLPHLGTATEESRHGMEVRALENLSEFLQGRRGKDVVPEMRDD